MTEIELNKIKNTQTIEKMNELIEQAHSHVAFLESNGRIGEKNKSFDPSKNTHTKEQLNEILQQHQLWLDTNGRQGTRADLSNAILISLDLQGVNLSQAILQRTTIHLTNLDRADLSGAVMIDANVSFSRLNQVDLSNAILIRAILINTPISMGKLIETRLQNAILYNAKLNEANLAKANLSGADCRYTDFIGAFFHENNFKKTNLLGAKFLNTELQNLFLNHNTQEAQNALANSLTSADHLIEEHSKSAKQIGKGAIALIILDLCAIIHLWFFHKTFISPPQGMGAWALTLYSFPILIVFSIAVTLFRHQKKLLDEVRHYSANKRQIELSKGLLEASQYVAMSLRDPEQSAMYIQETFSAIRDRLLNEQPHANTAGSAVEKEEYEEPLKVLTDAHSKLIDMFTKNKA